MIDRSICDDGDGCGGGGVGRVKIKTSLFFFMNIVREFKCRQRNNNCHRTSLFSHYRTTITMLLATRSCHVIINTFLLLLFIIVTVDSCDFCELCACSTNTSKPIDAFEAHIWTFAVLWFNSSTVVHEP